MAEEASSPPFLLGGKRMDENLGSFKTLEQVYIKATYDIEVNGKRFQEGETIAYFDKIQVAGLNEIKNYVAARGGYDNRGLVYWETTRELKLTFSQGVFSNTQFGLLNNAKIIQYDEGEPLLITKMEELESDEMGNIITTEEAYDQVFVYDKETGEKLNWQKAGRNLKIEDAYKNLVVRYRYWWRKCSKNWIEIFARFFGTRGKNESKGRYVWTYYNRDY